jgi:hypothetical protein
MLGNRHIMLEVFSMGKYDTYRLQIFQNQLQPILKKQI